MQFETRRLDLSYTLAFVEPIFAVASSVPAILERFHQTIGPRYFVGLDDLQSLPATSFGQVGAKVSLFGGGGTIQLMVDRLVVNFERLRTENDLKIVKDCLQLATDALRSLFPDVRCQHVAADLRVWLALAEGEAGATRVLAAHSDAGLISRLHSTLDDPAIEISPRIKLTISNGLERRTHVVVEPSFAVPDAHLFVACNDELLASLVELPIEEQALLVEQRYLAVLRAIGLDARGTIGAEA